MICFSLRYVRVDADKVPSTTVPLATIESWRATGTGFVKEMALPAFYKLQAGIKNEAGVIEWSDVEIAAAEPATVVRFVGGKAVRSAE
jgi:hypothetical protein